MISENEALRAYAQDALKLLNSNVSLYRQGLHPAYRVVAVQLRLLLCDTTHRHNELVNLALVPRLKPDLRLPTLTASFLDLLDLPAQIEVLDQSPPPISLPAWLDQAVTLSPGRQLSIRQWIRAVCDQDGGAHVDLRAAGSQVHGSLPVEKLIRLGETLGPELEGKL